MIYLETCSSRSLTTTPANGREYTTSAHTAISTASASSSTTHVVVVVVVGCGGVVIHFESIRC